MNYYVPLFAKIVDSSIWCEPDFVVKVFLTMLAKKGRGGVVEASAFMIAQWAKKTEAEVLEALKILSSPDTRRLEPQPNEGRRIEKVEGGWLILNAEFYQSLMTQMNRREKNAEAQARFREKQKKAAGQPANPPESAPEKNGMPPTVDTCRLLASKAGLPESEGDAFWFHHDARGWEYKKGLKMKSVGSAMGTWAKNFRAGTFKGNAAESGPDLDYAP